MESEIKKQVKELKKMEKTKVEDFLQDFDNNFSTHMMKRRNEAPILTFLFNEFINGIYKTSKTYKYCLGIQDKISRKLSKTLSKDEKELVRQLRFCQEMMLEDEIEQAFIYGYAMAVQMKDEAIAQYPAKEEE